jgi:hypothetical protein
MTTTVPTTTTPTSKSLSMFRHEVATFHEVVTFIVRHVTFDELVALAQVGSRGLDHNGIHTV